MMLMVFPRGDSHAWRSDNIAMGLPEHKDMGRGGQELSPEVMKQCEDAAKAANADGFIRKLPMGLVTPPQSASHVLACSTISACLSTC